MVAEMSAWSWGGMQGGEGKSTCRGEALCHHVIAGFADSMVLREIKPEAGQSH